MGEVQIPLNLIKTADNFPVEPLPDIMNSCLSTSAIPYLTKRASVKQIDKDSNNEYTQTTDMLVF